ncbi:nicotinamidase/pyrazinamidase [Prosthecobacter debontii]|uniref:Nicotinamidase n=1 Tax=Prosthecobacter debontii TaxID=48467 RepID=A0A1T4X773_9BACT|nr:bifunctional nicotinamidase/pyrazinamidase [Prosthecobacter debontii]SKA85396.1 nicotinamidase/pyrazinamidase [Prosthecobacter debontii]
MKTLLLIDLQNDFMPGGALAVPGGDEIIPVVNELLPQFDLIVATQDWHPTDHGSFAINHPGREVFEQATLDGLPQTLWPVHCVQNTEGALFAPGLDTRRIKRVFTKGMDPRIDSYSGLYDNGHKASTGMGEWLKTEEVTELHVAGVATDYCVKFTVLDALAEGFKVNLIARACRGVNLQMGDVDLALTTMEAAGCAII